MTAFVDPVWTILFMVSFGALFRWLRDRGPKGHRISRGLMVLFVVAVVVGLLVEGRPSTKWVFGATLGTMVLAAVTDRWACRPSVCAERSPSA